MGLLIDVPKAGYGNSNDGNTSPRFFQNAECSSRITGIKVGINPFTELSDEDFRHKYRFTEEFAMKIVDLIRDHLTRDTRECSVSPELQVVYVLRS